MCQAFLEGYFAGSNDITRAEDRLSSFKERALRTRVASRAMVVEKLPKHYCLPRGFSIQDMMVRVSLVEEADGMSAALVVRSVLESEFRCPW